VAINGSTVLSNFDIYAAAGGADKAIVESFTAVAGAQGQITISYTTVKDNAKSSGIEIIPSSSRSPSACMIDVGVELSSEPRPIPSRGKGEGVGIGRNSGGMGSADGLR
jgi:hypothetical protein